MSVYLLDGLHFSSSSRMASARHKLLHGANVGESMRGAADDETDTHAVLQELIDFVIPLRCLSHIFFVSHAVGSISMDLGGFA